MTGIVDDIARIYHKADSTLDVAKAAFICIIVAAIVTTIIFFITSITNSRRRKKHYERIEKSIQSSDPKASLKKIAKDNSKKK